MIVNQHISKHPSKVYIPSQPE